MRISLSISGFELSPSATERVHPARGPGVPSPVAICLQQPSGGGIEVSQLIGLEPVGENRKQQMAGQMRRRLSPEGALPARPQAMEIEIAQMRDLVVQRWSGWPLRNRPCSPHRTTPLLTPGDP